MKFTKGIEKLGALYIQHGQSVCFHSVYWKNVLSHIYFFGEREIQKYRVSLLLYIDVCIKNYICKYSFEQDVFVKHNAPDNGQFQRRPRSQGQVERSCHKK